MSRGFSEDLLAKSIKERVTHFERKQIKHPKLDTVDEQVLAFLDGQVGNHVLHVVGPSGVGKSLLVEKIAAKVLLAAREEMRSDRGLIPIVTMELPKIDAKPHNWKDFYQRLLLAACEPLVCSKISPPNLKEHIAQYGITIPRTLSTAADLRYCVERCVAHRGVRAVLVDEAQGFGRAGSGRALTDHMEVVKSLVNMSRAPLVLVGTYELLDLWRLNEQLTRRNSLLEFGRYLPNDEELLQFRNVINSFQKALPLEEEPDLVGRYEDYYERSCGCVGVLKEWLLRALKRALKLGKRTLTQAVVDDTAKTQGELKFMARAIADGERKMRELRTGDPVPLRTLLGMADETAGTMKGQQKTPAPQAKQKRVGERAPSRDNLGPLCPPNDGGLSAAG